MVQSSVSGARTKETVGSQQNERQTQIIMSVRARVREKRPKMKRENKGKNKETNDERTCQHELLHLLLKKCILEK